MWIVRVALDRPYTFIVLALLILLMSPVVLMRTPTDIFPNIDIPVIAVAWQYTGLNPEELEGRITMVYERILTTTVDNIEHIESTTVNGQAIVKIFLQPNSSLENANAQVTAISQTILRQLPPGTLPPLIINYSASSVPILQLGLSGKGLSEQQLNDLGQNFLRPQLVTVPGAVIPYPYGGKQRQIMIDLNPNLLQAKGLSPQDVLLAVQQQNVILPSGTAKIGEFEYDVRVNSSLRTVPEFNDLPIRVVGNSTIYLRDVANVRDGFARYLFVPLAEAVVFAMIASYILSRTLVPTLAMYLLKEHADAAKSSSNPFVRFQRAFEHSFTRLRDSYQSLLERLVAHRRLFIPVFLLSCLSAFLLIPWLGQDFFPSTDSGRFILHLRAKTGTRIEETAKLSDEVEASIRRAIPDRELDSIADNIGLPYSSINYMHSTSGLIGAGDADILVSLNDNHHPTANYMRELRKQLPAQFPGTTFYFLPADITTQILNFGLPVPVDIQIEGADGQKPLLISRQGICLCVLHLWDLLHAQCVG